MHDIHQSANHLRARPMQPLREGPPAHLVGELAQSVRVVVASTSSPRPVGEDQVPVLAGLAVSAGTCGHGVQRCRIWIHHDPSSCFTEARRRAHHPHERHDLPGFPVHEPPVVRLREAVLSADSESFMSCG